MLNNPLFIDPSFGFTANGSPLGSAVSLPEDEQWQFKGVQFHNITAGSVLLCVNNLNAGGTGFDVAVDDISLRTIGAAGSPPVAATDTKVLCTGAASVTVDVLANDVAGSSALDANSLRITTSPPFNIGSATINANHTITFTPVGAFSGSTHFDYQICGTTVGGITCCATATVNISAGSNPTASVVGGNAQSVCTGSAKSLTASASAGSGSGYSYSWSSGSSTAGTSVTPVSSPTTYTVTATDSNGCSATTTVAVSLNALPSPAASSVAICSGQNTSLMATASGGSGSSYAFTWNDGGSNPHNVSPASNTTYTVTVTDGNNCTSTLNKTVTVRSNPTILIQPVSAICRNASAILTTTPANGSGGYTYAWSSGLPATGTQTVTPTTTTIYNVTVTDSNGCTGTDNITVNVNQLPTADAGIDRAICNGGNTLLSASGNGGSGTGFVYNWNNGLGVGAPEKNRY